MKLVTIDYDAMTRQELVNEMKRLRREEHDIRREGERMISEAVRATVLDLDVVRGLLQLRSMTIASRSTA